MRPSTPDPLGHDDDVLTQSETLDEDAMGVDPLEGGMDPAELPRPGLNDSIPRLAAFGVWGALWPGSRWIPGGKDDRCG